MFKKRKSKADALREKLEAVVKDKEAVERVLREALGSNIADFYATQQQNQPQRLVNEDGSWVPFFEANGKTYYILNPKIGLSVFRQRELDKMSPVVAYDAGLSEITASMYRIKQKCNTLSTSTPDIVGLIEEVVNIERGIQESNRKWGASMMMCTLVIYEAGEDLKTWDIDHAHRKINDWVEGGFVYDDFFTLATQWSTRKITLRAKLIEEIKRGLRVFGFRDLP
jgi:hypothetical protein